MPTADATNPRIDRVVARLSVSVNQSVTFAIKTGTPAANPSAPALTRTSETYEISLARIAVGAGVTSIGAGDITDERGDATVCGVAGVKHSWQYLTNVAIDVSGMSVDAGVSDRDPVYFDGTDWVVATNGAVGFYDAANDAVITAGYLDGFTGLTPGEIVGNRGVALTATEIVVLETPVDTNGVKQVGTVIGTLTGDISGYLLRKGAFTSDITATKIITAGVSSIFTSDDVILFNGYLFNDTTKLMTTTNTGTITIGTYCQPAAPASTATISFYDVDDTITGTDSVTSTGHDGWYTKIVTIPATTVKIIMASTNVNGPNQMNWTDVYMTVTTI
ncbi:MAG: hypothetical protein PHU69_13305 [Fermentimonas sp.]|nr:hypothetical protein [Fermentimonas sp.]